MPQALLISIHEKWSKQIYLGRKTLEIRKTAPFKKAEQQMPFTVYMYESLSSGGAGLITGEFKCDCIITTDYYEAFVEGSGLDFTDLVFYAKGKNLTALHIKSSTKYDKPLKLSDFGLTRPPQSWRYVNKI